VKLGVLGGTFDPPHIGHLIAAQEAWRLLELDQVIFVPAAEPPHKRGRPVTPAPLRLAMLRAALADDARFAISELELARGGASYTVDTLRQLHAAHPEAELFLLLGADQVRELDTWREPAEVARLATIVAIERGGDPGGWTGRSIAIPRIDISSTEIRRRVAAGEPVRYLVPEGVVGMVGVYLGD
jgi:nicotinate-nucleotide adenylyltransferase